LSLVFLLTLPFRISGWNIQLGYSRNHSRLASHPLPFLPRTASFPFRKSLLILGRQHLHGKASLFLWAQRLPHSCFFLKKRKKLYDILRGEIISEFFKNNKNMSLHLINYSLIP
jgi:hypothetical protein